MSRRKCCCVDCIFFDDEFTRPNSSTVSGWTECAGDWEISGNMLKENGTAGAMIRCDTRYPYNQPHQIVKAWTYGETDGDKYRIYVQKGLDCNSSIYAELEVVTAAVDYTLRICDAAGATLVEESVTAPAGTSRFIQVCVSDIGFIAICSNAVVSTVWHDAPGSVSRAYFALGNGTSNPIYFTQAQHIVHWLDDEECPRCICQCYKDPTDKDGPPKTLTATFYGYGGCTTLTGFTMTLTYERLTQTWYGEATKTGCPGGDALFKLRMSCSDYPNTCGTWTLDNGPGSTCVDSDPDTGLGKVANCISCDPFDLRFGPFDVTSSDLACPCCGFISTPGTYHIWLTE